jgi:high-affinity iron transporter
MPLNQSWSTLARRILWGALALAALIVLGALVWQGIVASGNPDPTDPNLTRGAVILNTGLLVFREGLEVILVMAALTASLMGSNGSYRRPIAAGAGVAFLASIATWFIAIAVLDKINAPALDIQAATGLLAIVVLLVVMNWFFHKVYWTGWISAHNKRKRSLMAGGGQKAGATLGLALLGFSAMYREGFEVVLFLQSMRLRAGESVVLQGVAIGLAFTVVVGVLTFIAERHLPYKKMLIATGLMLAGVLIVMVGESVQEMQLAGWISTTPVALPIPDWMGLWFAIFPNVESLGAQVLAAVLVFGSYFTAQYLKVSRPLQRGETPAHRPEAAPVLPDSIHHGHLAQHDAAGQSTSG